MIVLYDEERNTTHASAVAIGVFDGLHRGHQKVIDRLCQIAKRHRALPTVVTFDPHPATLLAPERAPLLIATLDQRIEGLERLGVEQVRVLRFDERLAHESATSFIDRVLVKELSTTHVVVGEDFKFGHNREGDVGVLRSAGERRGFQVHPAPIFGDGSRFSSTAVRQAIQQSDLVTASAILGRPFALRGAVVHGDARGRDLGFPTANLGLSDRQILPGIGIYAGAVLTSEKRWLAAAVSVGTRPQFYDDGSVLVEVHLPEFSGDLYDQVLDVVFVQHLRGEMVFDDVDGLVAQIEVDVTQTLDIFKKFSPGDFSLLG